MRGELAKMARALESINEIFIPLSNCQIDPDPYLGRDTWRLEKAREACEACAEPQKTALLFILSQIAVVMMGGQQ